MDPAIYRCRGCGATFERDWLAPAWRPMADHVVACELADPKYRELARQWLADNALTEPSGRTPVDGEGAGS